MNEQEEKTVSLVVLSYNRPEMLSRALDSINEQTRKPDEVIVVDNKSEKSDEIKAISKNFPRFKWVFKNKNIGFAAGMNLGIRQAKSDFILLSEDDLVLDKDYVKNLLDISSQLSQPSFCCGIQKSFENTDQLRFTGGTVKLRGTYSNNIHTSLACDEINSAFYQTDFIPGSMFFGHRNTWKTSGLFRKEFFMYMEDTELSLRAKKAGINLFVVPSVVNYHFEPPSLCLISNKILFHKIKNLPSLYLLHGNLFFFPEFLIKYFAKGFIHNNKYIHVFIGAWIWFFMVSPFYLMKRLSLKLAPVEKR